MKYQFDAARLSKDKRAFLNEQVITKLQTAQVVSAAEVFNQYTGIGGLHGLKYVDFDSFNAYTEAKKEIELGQFFTPPELCEQIVQSLQPPYMYRIADFNCGSGNFFNSLPVPENKMYGIEIEPNAFKVAKFLYPDANIIEGDFVTVEFDTKFDMVVGNPPFNLKTPKGISQFYFMEKAAEYLRPGRLLCFIAPKTFLEDEYMNKHRLNEINSKYYFLCQAEISKEYFDVDIDIKVMYFQRHFKYSGRPYKNEYIDFNPAEIHRQFIMPVYDELKANAARLLLDERMNHERKEVCENGTVLMGSDIDRINKYLFELKTHPHLRKHHEVAVEKLRLLKTDQKPDTIDWREWDKMRMKPSEVINWMHKKIKQQYRKPKSGLRLVKTKNSIKYKAYSKADAEHQAEETIIDFILKKKLPKGKFKKMIAKKTRAYQLQETPFKKLERNPQLDEFLRRFELIENVGGTINMFEETENIKLNEKQFEDLGLAFQKRYSILNWQQGGGKSIAGMAWLDLVMPKVRHAFIAAPSLAVQLTWKPRLEKYGYNFTCIEKVSDFKKIRKGHVLLISFDMIRILERHVKNFIKKQCAYKIALLVDESDELSNHTSARTRTMRNCFRRGKYKILTTGTTTRNNINELYPQLELLYNNSINMLCWSTHVYKPDKDDIIQCSDNERYMQPFPAYYGQSLFRYCHCPQRTTVFGIQSDTQDIYNSDALKALIDKTIITRTFDDIVGKRIYEFKTHQVVQNTQEHALYAKIIDEFYSIVYAYFSSTGNERKEAMLRIIRQITLLIQSCSIPHTFAHYTGKELPAKFYHIHSMIKGWPDEKIAIGTVLKEAAQEYYRFLSYEFPDRKHFYIDGLKSFSARKKIIKEFQATQNGILISTQQSLKSSVDIETCDKCILEAMQWNLPKMSQYFFRFIRYSSKKTKQIHLVTYADSIEQNVLALLMTKEKLNEFIKNPDEKQTRADMMNEYDVDTNILNQLITKEYDKEGKLYLRWGNQLINK